jgi:hypothetical protein
MKRKHIIASVTTLILSVATIVIADKWSEYADMAAATIADTDTFLLRDVSDTTQAATGTIKEYPWSAMKTDVKTALGIVAPSDDPDIGVTGQMGNDTDGWLRTTYDSGTTQKALARVQEEIHITIVKPNDLADATRDKFPVWDNASGMSFIITEIEAWSDVDSSVFSVLEYAPQDLSSAAATIEASIDTGTTGTSVANVTVTSIDNATVENGNMIFLDFDNTDDPGWVKISIRGYYNADVN